MVEVVKTMPEEVKGETMEKKIQNIDGMKIETRFGDIIFQFHPEAAPKTVAQMKKAVAEGYFNGISPLPCRFSLTARLPLLSPRQELRSPGGLLALSEQQTYAD